MFGHPRLHIHHLGLAICTLAAPSACASEDDDAACEHRVCNIEDGACTARAARAVACQMQLELADVPEIRFMTAAEVIAEVDAEREEIDAETHRDYDDYYAGEAAMGLMPDGFTYESASTNFVQWAVAYYRRDQRDITIITDNLGGDLDTSYFVLVHELVHAYQDIRSDLQLFTDTHATSFDRSLAVRAVIEGEARLLDTVAELETDGLPLDAVNWEGFFEDYQANVLAIAAQTEVPALDVTGLFPYAFGVELQYAAWRDEGTAGIEALFDAPPDSVVQTMDWRNGRDDDTWNGDSRLDAHAYPALPEGRYTALGGRHASAWLVNAMLQRTAGVESLWHPVVDTVTADHLSVFRDEDTGEIGVFWRIQSVDADRLFDRLSSSDSQWNRTTAAAMAEIDGDVVLVATSGSDASPWLDLAVTRDWAPLDEPRGEAIRVLTLPPRPVPEELGTLPCPR